MTYRWAVGLLIIATVALRVLLVAAVETGALNIPFNPDAYDYISFGYNISQGKGFAHSVIEHDPYWTQVEPSAYRPPLYPLFLSPFLRFTRSSWTMRLAQVGLMAVAAWLLIDLATTLFSQTVGLVSGLIFAIYPPMMLICSDIGTECLFIVLLLAVLNLYYRFRTRLTWDRGLLLGIIAALTALCRPNGLMLFPAIVLAVMTLQEPWAAKFRFLCVLSVGAFLVIAPWTYRNYRIFHRPILIATTGGQAFWAGVHLRLEPGSKVGDIGFDQILEKLPEEERHSLAQLSEPGREDYYYKRASAVLRGNPFLIAKLFFLNFANFYSLVPSAEYYSLRNRIIYSLSYIPLLVAAFFGFVRNRSRFSALTLLYAWILTDTALYCVYLGAIRYRISSVDPILVLGAAMIWNSNSARVTIGALPKRTKNNESDSLR